MTLNKSYGRTLLPATAFSLDPALSGMSTEKSLWLPGIAGGAGRGTHTEGDVLTETVDGVPLNDLWSEFQQTIQLQNEERQRIIDLLTFTVSQPVERVAQMSGGDLFEEASEFGEPVGVRTAPAFRSFGYDFKWYDLAVRYTWKFLADARAEQVQSLNNLALGADSTLVFRRVMEAVFDNRTRTAEYNDEPITVYPFYNADGQVPPEYKNRTFDGTENHYMVSGGSDVTPQDVVDIVRNITEHGYGDGPGMTVLLLVNEQEGERIRQFRVDHSDSTLNGPHDFIPVREDMSEILAVGEQIAGASPPPNSLRGVEVIGRYGKAIVAEEGFIPAGYMAVLVSSGPDSVQNPVGIREHQNPGLRGLRLIKGRDNDYPLIDSFYGRALGTGVRHRGAGAVMQITTNATYTPPDEFTRSFNS